ncbi:MAG: hypothetical protein ABJF11_13560 [Reichenbachiella sp.]
MTLTIVWWAVKDEVWGNGVPELRERRQHKEENAQLMNWAADLSLDK